MTNVQHRITPDILDILANCAVAGNHLALPHRQLDRKTYEAVDKVLTLMGGKWNRGKRVHIFSEPPTDLLDTVLLTGEITDKKKLFQFYATPAGIVERMIDLADIRHDDRILEPSAGTGAILSPLTERDTPAAIAVELDPDKIRLIRGWAGRVHQGDFLSCFPVPRMGGPEMQNLGTFDKILMNPPFTRGQDVKHILHAQHFLKPGGRLVAICANGPKQQEALRPIADRWEDLPEGTFSESGTDVNTALVVLA